MTSSPPNRDQGFTDEQKLYLQGFAAGADVALGSRGLPTFASLLGLSVDSAPASRTSEPASVSRTAESIHDEARRRATASGGKLCAEEQAKRDKNPFELWDEMRGNAAEGRFPKGTDAFLYKFHGLFHVAPAQNAFMTRLRFPGGISNSHQLRGVAGIAERWGGGYADVTTRANLQIREIAPENALLVLDALYELGIINRGTGADNVRNVTGSPTAGIDPREWFDTRPLCREMDLYVFEHRELYGLPRKFNIAFDGGGSISVLADTNDIGFMAVKVDEGRQAPAGLHFRMELGGITGHKDFARDSGVLLRPEQCVPAAAAALRAFIEHGDRTDRKKARLKYVLDRLGLDGFLKEMEKHLKFPLMRFPIEDCRTPEPPARGAHIGAYPQRQPGLSYLGALLPVGRMTSQQMRGVAAIADRFGSGSIRFTVWQNLIIADIPNENLPDAQRELKAIGLDWSASSLRAGLAACTGSAGCKYAAADTKSHALKLAADLEEKITMDQPINIHLTGCHHSCAQHYIGDIGLLATKVEAGEEMVEGYHVHIGGGFGDERNIGREIRRGVAFNDLGPLLERLLQAYLDHRLGDSESFREFAIRTSTEDWLDLLQAQNADALAVAG